MKKVFLPTSSCIKNQKTHEIIASALVFFAIPIVNCFIITSGEQSALYNSLSRLAWPEGLLWLIYIWGVLNVGCFVYSTQLVLKAGGYSRKWQLIVITMEVVAAILITVGVSLPSYVDRDGVYLALRTIHTLISSLGFFGFYLILVVMTITFFKRNKRQAILSAFMNAFILIVGIFGLVEVSDPNSYCHVSSPAQVLLFDLFNVNAILNYYGMTLFDNDYLTSEEEPAPNRA